MFKYMYYYMVMEYIYYLLTSTHHMRTEASIYNVLLSLNWWGVFVQALETGFWKEHVGLNDFSSSFLNQSYFNTYKTPSTLFRFCFFFFLI